LSRAFVKENDLEHAGIDIPERPLSPHPNYVTLQGYQELQDNIRLIEEELQNLKITEDNTLLEKKYRLERDLRYFLNRIKSAIKVDPKNQEKDKVLFSATVNLTDENDMKMMFKIVGEDEADTSKNKISYVSPLAKALIGTKIGDEILWERPAGNIYLVVDEISYQN
jgi:transcription elongation factor GreB